MEHVEPFTVTTTADNDEGAMEQLLPQVKAHLQEQHVDMAGKSDEELKQMMPGMWTKQ